MTQTFFRLTTKILIRPKRCPGCCQFSQGAHVICGFSQAPTHLSHSTKKTNKMTCAPSKDSDQPGHLCSLYRVFAVCSKGNWGTKISSCKQRRLWSDWADTQADLSLHWAHQSFCWFCCALAHLLFQWKSSIKSKNPTLYWLGQQNGSSKHIKQRFIIIYQFQRMIIIHLQKNSLNIALIHGHLIKYNP